MHSLLLDLRHAARALRQRPGFAALAALTLGIGIGINAVAFSAINALLLAPTDVPHAERTGWIVLREPGNAYGALSLTDYRLLARETGTFEAVVAEGRLPVAVAIDGRSEQAWAMLITPGYMELLDERPRAGRLFTLADLSTGDLPALISDRFAARVFVDGSPLGRSLSVNGSDFTVVGIIRDGFQGPGGLYEPDLWLPLDRLDVLGTGRSLTASEPWLTAVARARHGLDRPLIEGRLRALFTAPGQQEEARSARSASWHPMSEPHPQVRGLGRLAWLGLAVVNVVLVIACFNVAGLLLARASERHVELALKTALGAARWRLIRQLVMEGLIVAAAGAAAALVVAAWSAQLLSTFHLPAPIPQRLHMGLDIRLVIYTAAVAGLAGTLPALAAALGATRADLFRTTKLTAAAGGRPSRTRNGLVLMQVAGSTLFLAMGLLFARSFAEQARLDPGFDSSGVLVIELTPSTYGYDAAQSRQLFLALRERASALPGVTHAALADRVPFYIGFERTSSISADGADCSDGQCPDAVVYATERGHFDALGIPLVEGRDLPDPTVRDERSVVVSRHLAERLWPGQSAVGRMLRLGDEHPPLQIVGVVADITHRSPFEPPRPYVYRPLGERDFAASMTLVVRTPGDPRRLTAALQEHVRALDPRIPPPLPQTMADRMEVPLWPSRTVAGLLTICGALALLLSGIGLFGVTYIAVTGRTREFGVRTALGATPRAVLALVLREGMTVSVPGILLGMAAAYLAARALAAALYGVTPGDPFAFSATAALQALIVATACLVPAWRATRVDPITALRHE